MLHRHILLIKKAPRTGTETAIKPIINNANIVNKESPPNGDGNQFYDFTYSLYRYIVNKESPPNGDGNLLLQIGAELLWKVNKESPPNGDGNTPTT